MLRNFYKRIRDRLNRRYRVEFIDDVTLSRSRELILKPITVIVYSLLLLVGIVGGTAALVFYTPAIHRHIPNYIDPEANEATLRRFEQELAKVEQRVAGMDTVRKSIQQVSNLGDEFELERVAQSMPVQPAPEEIEEVQDPAVAESADESPASEELQTEIEPYYAPEKKAIRATYFSPLMNLFPPVEGKIREGFSAADDHYGVDIVADEKALVRSVMDGFVVVSEYSDENGHMIGVSSGENLIAFYKHNSINYKKVGSYVFAGEPIAVIGNSGENSTGPHLHFELWQDGQPIDPTEYIEFNQ